MFWFLKKNVYKEAKHVYYNKPESKRQFMEWKHSNSSINKKLWAQQSVKKILLIVFWDMKGPSLLISLKKVLFIADSLGKIHLIYRMTLLPTFILIQHHEYHLSQILSILTFRLNLFEAWHKC